MIKLIAFLFTGCWHKWKIIHEARVVDDSGEKRVGQAYILQCERCGIVKRKDCV